jgi:hypothetical protein
MHEYNAPFAGVATRTASPAERIHASHGRGRLEFSYYLTNHRPTELA